MTNWQAFNRLVNDGNKKVKELVPLLAFNSLKKINKKNYFI